MVALSGHLKPWELNILPPQADLSVILTLVTNCSDNHWCLITNGAPNQPIFYIYLYGRLTFCMVNSIVFLWSSYFYMVNLILFSMANLLFTWSSIHFISGQLGIFSMANDVQNASARALTQTTTLHITLNSYTTSQPGIILHQYHLYHIRRVAVFNLSNQLMD